MNTEQINVEEFLTWFASQEDIPLQTRRDFFAHVQVNGGLDQKAIDYLDTALETISQKNDQRINVIKEKLDLVSNALDNQKVSEISLVEKIITDISQWFVDKVGAFKTKIQSEEMAVMKTEEDNIHDQEMDQVAALKAAL